MMLFVREEVTFIAASVFCFLLQLSYKLSAEGSTPVIHFYLQWRTGLEIGFYANQNG